MQVHELIDKTCAEGPGFRLCVWVQGCHHGCPDCFATHLWNPEGGYQIDERRRALPSSRHCGR
jgi:anaerobic ribonucleoside-triphosphate reductase activating protein